MVRTTMLLIAAMIVSAAGWSGTAAAGEKIPIDQLPAAVLKAVKERFPNGQLLSAERERDDGKLQFEVKVRDGGKKYEVEVTPDGKILEVEEED
jgi:uncharacterized membrane protein YkoI